MSESFRDELARLANPSVAATIAKEADNLTASLAAMVETLPSQDVPVILGLFWRRVLSELQVINKATESPSGDQETLSPPSADGCSPAESAPEGSAASQSTRQCEERIPIPPEAIEQALREFNEAETVAAIREIRETEGLTLNDFYEELEQLICPKE